MEFLDKIFGGFFSGLTSKIEELEAKLEDLKEKFESLVSSVDEKDSSVVTSTVDNVVDKVKEAVPGFSSEKSE